MMGRNQDIVKEYVSDQEIQAVFENTNFGENLNYREIVANSLLKVAAGYATGSTAMAILQELSLVGKRLRSDKYRYNLTKKGRKYLFYSQKVLRENAIPDGWKMVPIEPTSEMIGSGISEYYHPSTPDFEAIFIAMVLAAPSKDGA